MLYDEIRPSSMDGIKRLAKQIKKRDGIGHREALNRASRAASFENFGHARNALANKQTKKAQLFITIYWMNRDTYESGRETLEIWLNQPVLDLCSKSEMRLIRSLSNMRVVAPDHLVMDWLAQSQEYARREVGVAARALGFMEGTGLRPCNAQRWKRVERSLDRELPHRDHCSHWYDLRTGHPVLVDEPYSDPIVTEERADWAARNGWNLRAANWSGIYFPRMCAFFVASKISDEYDFERLMTEINALPNSEGEWDGVSEVGLSTFVSPLAITSQDRRRARANGTVYRAPSKTTIPCGSLWGGKRRRPNGAMGVQNHVETGRMIKAVLGSRHKPWSVNKRMDSIRGTLEDWLEYERSGNELQGPEFFEVYYKGLSEDDPYITKVATESGVIQILGEVRQNLQLAYPDCAPLRRLINWIDTSIKLTKRSMSTVH